MRSEKVDGRLSVVMATEPKQKVLSTQRQKWPPQDLHGEDGLSSEEVRLIGTGTLAGSTVEIDLVLAPACPCWEAKGGRTSATFLCSASFSLKVSFSGLRGLLGTSGIGAVQTHRRATG